MRLFFRSLVRVCIVLLAATLAAQARDLSEMSQAEITALQQRLADGGCYQGAIDGQAKRHLHGAIEACPSQDPICASKRECTWRELPGSGSTGHAASRSTGSDDKTVRVWSLPDGRLLRTLRVPIGPGDAGKIYATAVSPDGHWITAGGRDLHQGAIEHFVYTFDAATGAMVARRRTVRRYHHSSHFFA